MRFGWTAYAAVFAMAGSMVVAVAACGIELSGSCKEDICNGDSATGEAGRALPDGATTGDVTIVDGAGPPPEAAPEPDVQTAGLGIYVSPTGDDNKNAGTRDAPVKTIGKGIALAVQAPAPRFVYVCTATYTEQVLLAAAQDGVSIFGGFACPGTASPWSRDGAFATVEAPAPAAATGAVALHIDALVAGTTIEDMGFAAPAGKAPGESSVAALVTNANNVTLRRVKLLARDGAPGSPGTMSSNYTGPMAPGGTKGTGQVGGAAKVCTCQDGTMSTGGKGGDGDPGAGKAGDPGLPSLGGGAGGAPNCNPGVGGNSASAGPGGLGATSYGALTAAGWTPSPGLAGMNGPVGQGGGGGGGARAPSNGAAGSGGCGGCGGAGGTGGLGGGASIALASLTSVIALDACTLVAGNGGRGGKGGDAQSAQNGGPGGNSAGPCANGDNGGAGGSGGTGGGGGGGAGGVSVGVVYKGTLPNLGGAVPQLGTPGSSGPGGLPFASGWPGLLGVAAGSLQIP